MESSHSLLVDEAAADDAAELQRSPRHQPYAEVKEVALLLVVLSLFGCAAAAVVPPSDMLSGNYRYVSSAMGWTYFLAWTASFYPQVYLNFSRKTTTGLSPDFQLLNLLGFLGYAAFTSSLYFNEGLQDLYRARNNGHGSLVQLSDVAFAIHAAAITLVTIGQVLWYDSYRGVLRPDRRPSALTLVFVAGAAAVAILYSAVIASGAAKHIRPFDWLDFLYGMSLLKVAVTLVKYIPQALLNRRRQSTVGWSIHNVLLDLTGGLLSTLQLLLDCHNTHNWYGLAGMAAKLWLGLTSVAFECIFITQHFFLYRHEPEPFKDLSLSPRNGVYV